MTQPVRYHVDLTDRAHHLVRVTLTVPADLAPGARVVLPVWTPGSYVVRNYVHHVQWIRANLDGSQVPLHPDGVTAWRLPEAATGPTEVTLELYANDLSVRTNHVDDHHALLVPAATFPYVEGGEDREHQVHLPPIPVCHRVWSLLPQGAAADTYVAADRDHLVDAAFEVGAFPSVAFEVAGVPHAFVWAGHGGEPDLPRVAGDAAAIARACHDLFGGELPTDRYTFLTLGWEDGGGGLEHRDGSVLQVPVRVFQDDELYARLQTLVAHEYLHLWNVKRLTPAALVRPAYDRPTHSESLWVAEGWTAYYDELLPVRAGVWTSSQLLDALASVRRRLQEAPGTSLQSLRQASYEAWTKHYIRDENTPNAMTDYYDHGAMLAWELDLRLRRLDPGSGGLDDVLRSLWERHAGTPGGYGEEDVIAAVERLGGTELAALLEDRVNVPGLPQLDEVVAAVGLRWAPEEGTRPPHLGARITETDDGVHLACVLRDGPAWCAELSGGDRLLAVEGRTVGRGRLDAVLLAHAPGDMVEVTVARGPRILRREVTLAEPVPRERLVPVSDPDTGQEQAYRGWTGRPLGS